MQTRSIQKENSLSSSHNQEEKYIYPPHKPTEEILIEKAISLCNEGNCLANEGQYLKVPKKFNDGMYLYTRIRHLQYMRKAIPNSLIFLTQF